MDQAGGSETEASGFFGWLLCLAGILLAVVNLVFYDQIQKRLNPKDDGDDIQKKRGRYAVFCGTNIFMYIWTVQIFSLTVALPFFPSLVLSGVTGYVIANALLPDVSEQEESEKQTEDLGEHELEQEKRQDEDTKPEQREDDARVEQRQEEDINWNRPENEQGVQGDGIREELLNDKDRPEEEREITPQTALDDQQVAEQVQRQDEEARSCKQVPEDEAVPHYGIQEEISKPDDTSKEEQIVPEQQQNDEGLTQHETPGEIEEQEILEELEHALEQVLSQEERQNENDIPKEHESEVHEMPEGGVQDGMGVVANAPVEEENITRELDQAVEQAMDQQQRQDEESAPEGVTEEPGIPEVGTQDLIAKQDDRPKDEEGIKQEMEHAVEQFLEQEHQQDEEVIPQEDFVPQEDRIGRLDISERGAEEETAEQYDKPDIEVEITKDFERGVEQVLEQEHQREEEGVRQEDGLDIGVTPEGGVQDVIEQLEDKPVEEEKIVKDLERGVEQVPAQEHQQDEEGVQQEDGLDSGVIPDGGVQDDLAQLEDKPVEEEEIVEDLERGVEQMLAQEHQQDEEGVQQVDGLDSGVIPEGGVQDDLAQLEDKPVEEEDIVKDLERGVEQVLAQEHQQDEEGVQQVDGLDSGVISDGGVQDDLAQLEDKPIEEEKIVKDIERGVEQMLAQKHQQDEEGVQQEDGLDSGVIPDGGVQDDLAQLEDKPVEEEEIVEDLERGVEQMLAQEHQQDEEGVQQVDGLDIGVMTEGGVQDDIAQLEGRATDKEEVTKDLDHGIEQVLEQEHQHDDGGTRKEDGLDGGLIPKGGVQDDIEQLESEPVEEGKIAKDLERGVEQVPEQGHKQDVERVRQEDGLDGGVLPEGGVQDDIANLEAKPIEEEKFTKDLECEVEQVLEQEHEHDDEATRKDGLDSSIMPEGRAHGDLANLDNTPLEEGRIAQDSEHTVEQLIEQEHRQNSESDPHEHVPHEEGMSQDGAQDAIVKHDNEPEETEEITKYVEEVVKRAIEQEQRQEQEILKDGAQEKVAEQVNELEEQEEVLEQEHRQSEEPVRQEHGHDEQTMPHNDTKEEIALQDSETDEKVEVAKEITLEVDEVLEHVQRKNEEGNEEIRHELEEQDTINGTAKEEEKKQEDRLGGLDLTPKFGDSEEQGITQEKRQEEESVGPEHGHDNDSAIEDPHQEKEPEIEEDPFEKVLRQLGITKGSRLGLLDQRSIREDMGSIEDPSGDVIVYFFQQLSAGMADATQNLSEKYPQQESTSEDHIFNQGKAEQEQYERKEHGQNDRLSNRDILFAILTSCDQFLLQEVLRQFVMCGIAVPVIMPRLDDTVICPLWGLRKATVVQNDPTSSSFRTKSVTATPFFTVSAIRVGQPDLSKSTVLNGILKRLNCSEDGNIFMSENKAPLWSRGTVEAAWHLPPDENGPSKFPLALYNLRGDSAVYKKQAQFCIKASNVLIVFTGSFQSADIEGMFTDVSPDVHVIMVAPSSEIQPPFTNISNITVIDTNDRTEEQISQTILEVITGRNCHNTERESLENISEMCNDLEIVVDESFPECHRGKKTAMEIMDAIGGKSKQDLFPLQNLWKEWVEVNNETLGEQNIEHELSKILEKKKKIRSSQKNSALPTAMDKFIESLDSDGDYKYYTYYWLEMLLDQQSSCLESQEESAESMKEPGETQPVTARSGDGEVDITDFHQELGQMVESEHPRLKQTQDKESKSIFEHFMELQSTGVPIQLFDSDACAVPLEWLEDASMHFDTTEGKPRVRVISVIGNPKSFKTTLLNRLYGVNFSTTGHVSTKGMLMHLVPVKYPTNEQIGCDFLLIIDTQSFNLADDPSPEDMKRNEYITTLTLCISDLVIVNDRQFKNTSNGGSKLLDPGFVRGLARMKEVNKSGKCLLVQHCEAELTENTDNETLSEQLFEKAMKDLSENPKSELMMGPSEDLFDVFNVDNKKRAMVIPYTDTEMRPGATKQSCEQVTATRKITFQFVAQCNRAQMSFVDFCQRITDVTNALKKEEFVKDFRDTNIENLKDEFVLWYRDLLLKLQSDLTANLTSACNELGNVPFDDIAEAKDTATNELTREVEDGFENVKLQIQEQLRSKNYDSLSDQEEYFQKDIGSAKDSFLQKIPENFERVLQVAERNKKTKKGTQQEGDAFLSKLAKNVKPKRSDEAILKEFEQALKQFIEYLRRKYPMHTMSAVHQNTEDNTMYMLKQCGDEVEALLSSNTLPECVDSHKQIMSVDDVNELKQKFNVAKSAADEAFEKVKCRLCDDCEKPEGFADSSKEFVQLLKSLEPEFQDSVENVNMYLFVLAKFISEMHKAQLENEKESRIGPIKDDNDEEQSNIKDIKREVDGDNYQIKQAEPLDFPTIDSKIASLLSDLKGICSDEELEVLKEVLTPKNIRNCSALPFDLVTMQRLDRSFICMLPPLHSEDMKSINDTVTESKMIMFGKAMSKQRFDHGKTFNEIYSLTQKAIIDDKIEGQKARAAALVHLFAWSTGIIDVKKLEDLKGDNVALTFEKEQSKLCLVQFKSQHKHNCDDLVAEIICDEVERSLVGLVEESLVTRLREYFLLEAGVLNLKRTYIGTVLRDLSLKEDYLGFAYFLKTYKEFSEKWILNFIASESNKAEESLLIKILTEVLDAHMNLIKTVIDETNSEFEKQSDRNLPTWLDIFQTKLSDKSNTSCRANTVEILRDSTKVERFDNFTEQLVQNLDTMRGKLEGSVSIPIPGNEGETKTWLLSLSHQIHVELGAVVRGCIEQCPFCGAACESTLGEHEFHETVLHYPGGVKGWHDVASLKLFTDICTSAVASTQQYRTSENEFRPYREYKTDHPKWEIPGKIGEPMEFWQYVFNKFNAQFARHYGCEEGDVPSQWTRITKEEAVRSVEKAYKLNPIIMGE